MDKNKKLRIDIKKILDECLRAGLTPGTERLMVYGKKKALEEIMFRIGGD